jgi:ornithine cyclodeaminase/alanine dehydrogenase
MKVLDELHDAILLSEEEVRKALDEIGWPKIIDAVAETFIEEAKGETVSPPKVILDMREYNSDYRAMPSRMLKYPDYCGVKIIGACTDNPTKHNLPLAMGLYVLSYAPTLETLMICSCNELTAYRTAAATAVALRELSRGEPKVLGIIGCGQQAYYHIPAILTAKPSIEEILVNDLSVDNMSKLAKSFPDLKINCGSKKILFEKADVIVTMTPTTEPHIFKEDIPDRELLLCSVGGDAKHKLELHPEILTIADHFCDSYDQVIHTGMVFKAIKEGIITQNELRSLGTFMTTNIKMKCMKKLRLFLSTGVALEDIITAILVYSHMRK